MLMTIASAVRATVAAARCLMSVVTGSPEKIGGARSPWTTFESQISTW